MTVGVITRLRADMKHVLLRLALWALLTVNVVSISSSLYLFRYAIYCGLGIGFLAVLIYVPTLILVVSTMLYKGGGIVTKARNYVLGANVVFIALLLLQGICFSCVNTCVENLQR